MVEEIEEPAPPVVDAAAADKTKTTEPTASLAGSASAKKMGRRSSSKKRVDDKVKSHFKASSPMRTRKDSDPGLARKKTTAKKKDSPERRN